MSNFHVHKLAIQCCEGYKSPTIQPVMYSYVPSIGKKVSKLTVRDGVERLLTKENFGRIRLPAQRLTPEPISGLSVEFPTQFSMAFQWLCHADGLQGLYQGKRMPLGIIASNLDMLSETDAANVAILGPNRTFSVGSPIPIVDSKGKQTKIPCIRDFAGVNYLLETLCEDKIKNVIKVKMPTEALEALATSWAVASMKSYFVPAYLLLNTNEFIFFQNAPKDTDEAFLMLLDNIEKDLPSVIRTLGNTRDYDMRSLVFSCLSRVKKEEVILMKLSGICRVFLKAAAAQKFKVDSNLLSGIGAVGATCDLLLEEGFTSKQDSWSSDPFVTSSEGNSFKFM